MAKTPQQYVTTVEGWATAHLVVAAAIALVLGFVLGAVLF